MKTLRTIRHLRPRQVIDRITRRFVPLPRAPGAGSRHRLVRGRRSASKIGVGTQRVGEGTFRFLNESLLLTGGDRWLPERASALWRYQLHYFQYLRELAPLEAVALFEDWLALNPPGSPVAWDPYPISLRAREWIEWLLEHPEIDPVLERAIVASLVHQTLVLERRLEYDLMANHLLENAISLCWVGLSLDGPAALRWRRRGSALLRRELLEQVLADGTHYERSPMYQASIAESLLRLAEVAAQTDGGVGRSIAELTRATGGKMVRSLSLCCHPDGDVALLNDCALGQAPTLAQLQQRFGEILAEAPDPAAGVWRLADAGYMGWRGVEGSYLVFDGGDIGPDYNPAHGHADALSFELSHRGRRLLTDTGVLTYAPGMARSYDRSTAAHNTLEIDGASQSELWAAFRCARRTKVVVGEAEERDGGRHVVLRAGYRGPATGRRFVAHSRRVDVTGSRLGFVDTVDVLGGHEAVFRLHLAPGLKAQRQAGAILIADEAGRALARVTLEASELSVGASPYHPEFGLEIERATIETQARFRDRFALEWSIDLL